MRFLHSPVELGYTDLANETGASGRYYTCPGGEVYPSITTVLGVRDKGFLEEWRSRVGVKEANRVGTRAANRGSQIHDLMERYISGGDIDVKRLMPHIQQNFKAGAKALDAYLGTVCLQECPLFSHHLKLAGRVDLIGEWDGVLSIVDFKTSIRKKTHDDIHNYFIQKCAYSIMFEEITGTPINRLVTVIMVDGQRDADIFIEKRNNWAKELLETITLFNTTN